MTYTELRAETAILLVLFTLFIGLAIAYGKDHGYVASPEDQAVEHHS